MTRLAVCIMLLMILPPLFSGGGAPCPPGSGGGPGGTGAPAVDLGPYYALAHELIVAINADDPRRYEALLSLRIRGAHHIEALRVKGRAMVQSQGKLARAGHARALANGRVGVVLNAARGGWVVYLRLDAQGRATSIDFEAV